DALDELAGLRFVDPRRRDAAVAEGVDAVGEVSAELAAAKEPAPLVQIRRLEAPNDVEDVLVARGDDHRMFRDAGLVPRQRVDDRVEVRLRLEQRLAAARDEVEAFDAVADVDLILVEDGERLIHDVQAFLGQTVTAENRRHDRAAARAGEDDLALL